MSAAELEKQRNELAGTLAGFKRLAEENKDGIQNVQAAMSTLQEQMRALGEAQVAANQPKPTGSEKELEHYKRSCKEADIQAYRENYHIDEDLGPVRMLGHYDRRGRYRAGLLDDPEPRHEAQLRLQEALTTRAIVRSVIRKRNQVDPRDVRSPLCDELVQEAARALPGNVRIFSDTDNLDAWFENNVAPGFERDLEMTPRLAPLFRTRVKQPGGTTRQRYRSKRLLAFLGSIPAVDDPPNAELSKTTYTEADIDVKEMVVATQNHRDATEDSALMDASLIAADLRWGLVAMDDIAILHGDTNATHQDAIASWNHRSLYHADDVAKMGLANDARTGWIGLRARAYDVTNTTDQNAAQSVTGFQAARAKLAVEHALGDVVCIVSPEYFLGKMLQFSELLTWDKAGPFASLLTGTLGPSGGPLPGQVGFIQGVPVVVNWFMSGDLAATGLYTGSGTTTGMLMVSRSRFERWVRKGVTIESEVNIRNNTVTTVARKRDTFRSVDNDNTTKNVHYSFNLTY